MYLSEYVSDMYVHMYVCMHVYVRSEYTSLMCMCVSEYVSVIYVLHGETKDSMTALWLMYNLY